MSAAILANRAGVGIATIKRFESGQSVQAATINAIMWALLEAGITFITAGEASQDGGDGVRLTKPTSS
jgi:predicted transcriptional regulator